MGSVGNGSRRRDGSAGVEASPGTSAGRSFFDAKLTARRGCSTYHLTTARRIADTGRRRRATRSEALCQSNRIYLSTGPEGGIRAPRCPDQFQPPPGSGTSPNRDRPVVRVVFWGRPLARRVSNPIARWSAVARLPASSSLKGSAWSQPRPPVRISPHRPSCPKVVPAGIRARFSCVLRWMRKGRKKPLDTTWCAGL